MEKSWNNHGISFWEMAGNPEVGLHQYQVASLFCFINFQACKFDLESLKRESGCTKDTNYGYQEGTPCVLLKLNKVKL